MQFRIKKTITKGGGTKLHELVPNYKKVFNRLDNELYLPAVVSVSANRSRWSEYGQNKIGICLFIMVGIVISALVFVICRSVEASQVLSYVCSFVAFFFYCACVVGANSFCKCSS